MILGAIGRFKGFYANLGRFWSNLQISRVILVDYKVICGDFVATYRDL